MSQFPGAQGRRCTRRAAFVLLECPAPLADQRLRLRFPHMLPTLIPFPTPPDPPREEALLEFQYTDATPQFRGAPSMTVYYVGSMYPPDVSGTIDQRRRRRLLHIPPTLISLPTPPDPARGEPLLEFKYTDGRSQFRGAQGTMLY